jgi:uncharacterized protein YndB with AHSA1/START domain
MARGTFTVDKDNLEVRMEYTFKASPERLFKAFTTAEDIARWWGPKGSTVVVDKLDFKVGGQWRFIETSADGSVNPFHGVYTAIDQPRSYSNTFVYEPWGEDSILEETTALEVVDDDHTTMISTTRYKTIDDLNRMVDSGMEKGATEGMDCLEELLGAGA